MSYAPMTLQTVAVTPRDDLLEMLRYKRPHDSVVEKAFIDRFIVPLGATPDGFGNLWLDIGLNPEILFSSHVDTVHHDDGMQDVVVSAGFATAVVNRVERERTARELEDALKKFAKDGEMPPLPTHKSTNCLGADCTTGVWLMRWMILHGIPGRYVWHRDEESGGRGSSYVAKREPERLDGIKFAIAFDRKGYSSIITDQAGGMCASDEFAHSLADALGMNMEPDPTGTFTDTANYTDLIPECTNISVGYFDQHGPKESQDLDFAERLLENLIAADFTSLVCKRQVGDRGDYYSSYYSKSGAVTTEMSKMEHLIMEYPDVIAQLFEAQGWSAADLEHSIEEILYQ